MNIFKLLIREIHRAANKAYLKIFCRRPKTVSPAKADSLSKIKKIAFINGCPDNRSERYRIDNITEALASSGIRSDKYSLYNLDYLLKHINDYDLLIIFRVIYTANKIAEVINAFQSHGIPVVFDTDDLIFYPEVVNQIALTDNFNEKKKRKFVAGIEAYKKTALVCDASTVTTDYLKRKLHEIGAENAFVIKNTINEKQYKLAQKLNLQNKKFKSHTVKICYLSGSATHNTDFKEAEDALLMILEKYKNAELNIVGPLVLDKKFKKYKKQIKRIRYMNYLKLLEFTSKIDINIAPLEMNNPYNEGKSELKIFESALVGVPSVVSAVDSYSKCVKNGMDGFLAKNRQEWFDYLSALIEDKELRRKIGDEAYKSFAEKFYVKNNISDIITVYESIINQKEEYDSKK